jgi:hypothetical protein
MANILQYLTNMKYEKAKQGLHPQHPREEGRVIAKHWAKLTYLDIGFDFYFTSCENVKINF